MKCGRLGIHGEKVQKITFFQPDRNHANTVVETSKIVVCQNFL